MADYYVKSGQEADSIQGLVGARPSISAALS